MVSPKHKKKDKPSKLKQAENSYLRFYAIALEVVAYNILCIWGGLELSNRFSPNSYWTLFMGIFLAVAGTIYFLLKKLGQ